MFNYIKIIDELSRMSYNCYIRGRVSSMPSLTGYESLSPADLLKRSIALAPRSRGPTFIKPVIPEVVPIVPKAVKAPKVKSEPKTPKVPKVKSKPKTPKVPKAVKAPKTPKILKTSAQLQRQAAGYILAAANASIREGK